MVLVAKIGKKRKLKKKKNMQRIVPGIEICKEYLLRKQIYLGRKFILCFFAKNDYSTGIFTLICTNHGLAPYKVVLYER